MAASISSSIIACLKSFNEFIEEIRNLKEASVRGLVVSAWEDELGRLRMWAANIGAHQTGQSSLDFRLRDASHVREQIVKLLQGLLRRLQDARDVLAEDESDDQEVAADFVDEDDPKTEIQELRESLATVINCLFQMSMLVRKPAQHDVHVGSKGADVAAFEPFDYNHVREKYPRADDALLKRLGKAITRRRKYLKYRERHAIKLRQGIDNVECGARNFRNAHEGETMEEGIASILSDTVATGFRHQNIDFDDDASDTGISQTSYAPTLLSGGNVTIPPPPKSSLGGEPFECPYCFYLITSHGARSWNKHVFQDLQPYICIAPTCPTPDKFYSTRHEWLHHSNMAHPTATTDHDTPKESKDFATCSLCTEEVVPGKQYDRHLARHLQELALFILPGTEEDSDVGEDQDAESSSSTESVDLAIYRDSRRSSDSLPASPGEQQAAVENSATLFSKHGQDDTEEDDTEADLRMQSKESEDVLAMRERVLGSEHPDTLRSMTKLASAYYRQGRYEEAAKLERGVLGMRERVLGSEHPNTLTSMISLARAYQRQGKLKEAEMLYQKALIGSEKIFGVDHTVTLETCYLLGSLYEDRGRLKEAEAMYQRALNGQEKQWGPGHVLTMETINSLSNLYTKQGKLAEAEKMYQPALN